MFSILLKGYTGFTDSNKSSLFYLLITLTMNCACNIFQGRIQEGGGNLPRSWAMQLALLVVHLKCTAINPSNSLSNKCNSSLFNLLTTLKASCTFNGFQGRIQGAGGLECATGKKGAKLKWIYIIPQKNHEEGGAKIILRPEEQDDADPLLNITFRGCP